MRYTRTPLDTFQKLQLNAGILLSSFNSSTGAYSQANIIGVTSGGVSFSSVPSFVDLGEDIDNCPDNTKELARIDGWEILISGSFITIDANRAKSLLAAADVDSAKVSPRASVVSGDFADIWWVGDYSDKNSSASGGFIAIHMINALSSGGFKIQSGDKQRGQFEFEYKAYCAAATSGIIPCEIYVKAGTVTSNITITSQPSSTTVPPESLPYTLSVVATTSVGTLAYQWYQNGISISGATSASYIMPNTLSVGTYSYTCAVSNGVDGDSITTDAAVINVANATYSQLGSISTSGSTTAPSWFIADLAAGTYGYKLDVGGASDSDTATAILVKQASSNSDASGTTIVTKTCAQCNGGASFTGTFTVTGTTPYIYMKYTPFTGTAFTATFSLLED